MLFVVRFVACYFFRILVWMRYRLRTRGLEKVRALRGPTLILPNHPALVDPLIVMTQTWPIKQPRPMLFVGNFQGPVMGTLMKLLNAAEVPSLDQFDARVREKTAQAIQTVIEGLRNGENFVIWPSGRLERDGLEHLGSATALTEILRAVPEVNVVVVRTRGLFGSMSSVAPTGKLPDMYQAMRRAVAWLLANFLFFMPRRSVTQTYEVVDKSQLPPLEVDQVNPWFDAWYNAEGREEPTFVPYHWFLGPREYVFPPPPTLETVDVSQVDPAIRAEVEQELAHKIEEIRGEKIAPATLPSETTLDSLGLNSLARKDAAKPVPPEWFAPLVSDVPLGIEGDTVAAAFIERALRCRRDVAVVDDLAGVLTYEKLLVGVLSMAERFRRLDGDNVGLLLPASAACDVTLLGLLFAGKLPVVLNWTTGPANLAHAARLMGLRNIVTSKTFLNRAGVEIPDVRMNFLEDLRGDIGRFELLRLLFRIRWMPGSVRAGLPKIVPDQPAVVLFTSGSEKAPKAVPLTHRNLIANIRMALEGFQLHRSDSILGFLPAFHSFGLTITGLMPLLSGIRVVRHPDPTDAGGLSRKLASYRPTLMAGTPTFVGYILDRAGPGDLDSLRLIVVGAEKCPQGLFDAVQERTRGAQLLEGYGITECSPVVSANRPGRNKPGTVGQPFHGVEVRIVDLATHEPLPTGQQGLLLVSGPTIFPGYVGHEGDSPFLDLGGKRWYVTGDLACLDAEGFIHFRGRLKRFLKAGGEMISLPALEEPLAEAYPPKERQPQIAVEGVEREGGRAHLVLFTTVPNLTLREANQLLEQAGFQGVMRLNEVRQVDEIPVLGTGKTDYKVLRARI